MSCEELFKKKEVEETLKTVGELEVPVQTVVVETCSECPIEDKSKIKSKQWSVHK